MVSNACDISNLGMMSWAHIALPTNIFNVKTSSVYRDPHVKDKTVASNSLA